MSIPTDDNRELLSVVATMRAQPGKEQELRELLESLISPTRAEEACVTYALHQGAQDPAVFIFYENWASQAALDAHLGTPHLQAALRRSPELLDGDLANTPLHRIA
ncbi:MAG: antibiotic biosynthesis monooxygenase [Pseudonocardia sp.]|nr:antibiotic biosynthesis monooxygenase [Pseudonocardia sp.]